MFERKRKAKLVARAFEEGLYEIVASELRAGIKKDGLWLKAVTKSRGNDDLAKSEYVELRLQSLKDEIEVSELIDETNTNGSTSVPASEEVHVCTKSTSERASDAIDALRSCGFIVQTKGIGWIIQNPKGGKARFNDIRDMENYAIDVKKSQTN